MHIDTLSPQLHIDSHRQSMLIRLDIVQTTLNGCSDFVAQCIIVRIPNHCTYHPFYSLKSLKVYRCWIVWDKNIFVVIFPSFLAITYIGQSIYLHHDLIS